MVRVLGEIRYEYEPDVDGGDEYSILDEIEKNQRDSDDDMIVSILIVDLRS